MYSFSSILETVKKSTTNATAYVAHKAREYGANKQQTQHQGTERPQVIVDVNEEQKYEEEFAIVSDSSDPSSTKQQAAKPKKGLARFMGRRSRPIEKVVEEDSQPEEFEQIQLNTLIEP
jgi:hypothetical protein